MASLNKVYLMGNVTRDPQLRHTPGGSAVCAFGLAVNRRYSTAQGEDREEVCFVDIEAWGKQAEPCANYLGKGAPVLIEGRLRYDQWDDRETGKKRSRLTVWADRVQFLGQPSRNRGVAPEAPAEAGSAPKTDQPQAQARPSNEPPPMPPFEADGGHDDDIPF